MVILFSNLVTFLDITYAWLLAGQHNFYDGRDFSIKEERIPMSLNILDHLDLSGENG